MMPQNKKLDRNRSFIINTSLSKFIFFILIINTLLFTIGYSEDENLTSTETQSENITFEILSPIESAYNYSNGLEFLLRVNIYSKANLLSYLIEHNFTNSNSSYSLNCTKQEEHVQGGLKVYECNYSFSNLTSNEYKFKLLATDVNNFSKDTEDTAFLVQKAKPNITLFIGSEQSNYQCLEGSTVNLKAFVLQSEGVIELFFNGSKVATGSNNTPINFSTQINPVGIYEVSLIFNETQNYLAKNITRTINVTPFEFNIVAKQEYPIGSKDKFILYAPENSTVSILNYGPEETIIETVTNGKLAECVNTLILSNDFFPKEIDLHCTNKTGEYIIEATLTKNNITKKISQKYKIKNSIDISLNGKTSYLKGDDVKLSVSATGGILPYKYSWQLENGTKIMGKNLNIKYDSSGSYETRLDVIDKEGNAQEKLFTISINDWYQIDVKVIDSENKSIALASVSFDDEKEYTNDSGVSVFKLIPADYELRVSASGYKQYIMDYEVKKNETLVIRLEPSDQATNTISRNNEIVLLEPYDNQILSKGVVYFKANVAVNKDADCILYVAQKDSSWFEQIADFSINSKQNLSFNKEFENGTYKWKVECSYEGSLPFSSEIYSFELKKDDYSNETSLISYISSTDDEELIDAGRIRSRIDEAYTNLENLDYQDQGPANALNFRNNLDLALRDFERILRDINALQFRRDLSDSEKDKKRNEYQESLELLENNTFYDIVVKESKDFVIYPKKEDLSVIAKEYAENSNLQGNLDLNALNDLQNKILIKTTISHVELYYIDERIEEITLIDKEITLTENASQKSFLLEYVPKEASQSTDEITMVTKGDIIKKDPLLKFPKESKRIIYYINGTKDLETVKNSLTILLSEEVFSSKSGIGGNLITGAMIFSFPELSSTAWLVVVLVFILIVYLVYAFDLLDYTKNVFGSNKKKEHQMNLLINDCKDYLDAGNLAQANLVFKEIKLHYEKYPKQLKAKVYKDAILVFNEINKKFFEKVLEDIASKKESHTKESLERKKCLLIDSYNALDITSKEKYKANYDYLINLMNKLL